MKLSPARAARLAAETALGDLLDFLYPPLCAGCGGRLPDGGEVICLRCLARIERADADALSAVLRRLPAGASGALERVFALWMYDRDGVVQRLQNALKYGNLPRLGPALGALVGEAFLESEGPPSPDALLLPIPLSRVRRLERGYNQSALLACGIGARLGLAVREDVLVRRRATRSQTALDPGGRWRNVSGAFAAAPAAPLGGRRVLLVDDLFTTGATAASAALTLLDAGAASVSLLALGAARL